MNINVILLIISLVLILGLTLFAGMLVLGPIITGFRKAPYVPSFDYHLRVMKKHLTLEKGANVVDLGCGDGKALRFFSKEYGLIGTGYDLNPFVIRYGRFTSRFLGFTHITLIRSDFKKAPLKRYKYIYLYLFPNQLISIEDWIFEHMDKESIIISNSFTFGKHKPFEVIYDERGKKVIYLYKK